MSAAFCAPVIVCIAEGASEAPTGAALSLPKGPHLFLDDYLIGSQSNLKRVINLPERLSEPVITGKEDGCFQPYVTVVRDPVTRRFRVWYGVPENAGQSHLAHMESDDGIHWKRPHQVLKDPAFIQFGASVIDEGPAFPDRQQRYKYGWYGEGGLRIAASPDGLNWRLASDRVVLEHSHDINCIYRDPATDDYIALVSFYATGEKWTGSRRITFQSRSKDLIHWEKPWLVFSPDERDEGETQFYCMGGLIRRGGLLIGMLRVLRDDLKAEGAPEGAYGIGYTVLAWSRDGVHWQRDREPFLPRNPEPRTWDHAMAWADCQLLVDGQVYIYYGGYAWGHKHERFTQRQIGLARMKTDRYVSRDAGEERGWLQTPLLLLNGRRITVNADVTGGLQVRIVNEQGKPVRGFDWTDCAVITGDSLNHALRWKKQLSALRGKPVRIEFALRQGRLYGFGLE